jgi:hypothetical protein
MISSKTLNIFLFIVLLINSSACLKLRASKTTYEPKPWFTRGNGCDKLTKTGKGGNGVSDYCQQEGICGGPSEGKAYCRSDYCQVYSRSQWAWKKTWYGCDEIWNEIYRSNTQYIRDNREKYSSDELRRM